MTVRKTLAWIVIGYGLALAAGLFAVWLNEMLVPADVSQTSGGMVAFGDMILFVMVAGAVGLVPTWLLLKLLAEKAPALLRICILLAAVTGLLSWLLVIAGSSVIVPVLAIPRIACGPIVLVAEGMILLLVRRPGPRRLVALAMLIEAVPMVLFVVHLIRAVPR